MKEFCSAVVVAAGSSRRMGGEKSKIFMELGEKTVIELCLEVFEQTPCIEEIIVVCREEDRLLMEPLARKYPKVKELVPGGETRSQSVENGIALVDKKCTLLAIHDGARPLVTAAEIEKVVCDASKFGAATLATPVKDTIKIASPEGWIESTPPRSSLWAVQTPQVFKKELYEEAVRKAKKGNEDITDDCQLMERMGHKVYLTEGAYTNLKITTPEDIPMAEAIWKERTK